MIRREELAALGEALKTSPQAAHSCLVHSRHAGAVRARYAYPLRGYGPIGFFQLWHTWCQKPYPHSLGSAFHDDVIFGASWPASQRRLLPTAHCYHLCAQPPVWGGNREGARR